MSCQTKMIRENGDSEDIDPEVGGLQLDLLSQAFLTQWRAVSQESLAHVRVLDIPAGYRDKPRQ